jgi:hypothetical protein
MGPDQTSGLLFAIAFARVWLIRPGATVAQGFSAQHISLSAVIFEQGAIETNHGTTVTKPLSRSAMTTESLVEQLAADEYASTNWSSNSFPRGAKLNFAEGSGFSIVDSGGQQLANVANILTWQAQGNVSLLSGNADKAAQTQHQVVKFVYDTSSFGGTASFNVTALASLTARTTKPDASGNYLEIDSLVLQNGVGEGTNAQGRSMIITGFILTASGTQSLNTNTVPEDVSLEQCVSMFLNSHAVGPPPPPPVVSSPPLP